ncbi:MAG: hypothetical protein ACETWQ_00065 [Phycisphaerae bacterium]
MYKIFMLIAVPALIIGWIAYAYWIRKVCEEERQQPKEESKRLTKTKSEVADWAQKMAQFKKPERKKPSNQDDQNKAE